MWCRTAVVGVTPAGSTAAPSSAFTKVVLPWLNSPSTTRWNRSSSSFGSLSLRTSEPSETAPASSARSASACIAPRTSYFAVRKSAGILAAAFHHDRHELRDLGVHLVLGRAPA